MTSDAGAVSAPTSPPPRLVGSAEAALIMGVSRQRMNTLSKTEPGFPAPLQVLASGPIWEQEAITEYVKTRDTRPGNLRSRRSQTSHFYVEVSYDRPGSKTSFRCWTGPAKTPKDAEHTAIEETATRYPDATNVEMFLSRRITPERAELIRRQFDDGTWAGWFATQPGNA